LKFKNTKVLTQIYLEQYIRKLEIRRREVFNAVEVNQELDEEFIEKASNVIHEKWLERNGEWASEEQNKPYAELDEEEKDKDRAQIKKAIEIFNKNKDLQ
jgi:hypothetical protein